MTDSTLAALPGALRAARQDRAHGVRAAVRLRRRVPAVDGVPSAHDLFWVTVAMVGARSLAMALNRLIDAGIDARNPRTATREIPAGLLGVGAVVAFCARLAGVLPGCGLAARPARPLAVADPGRRVRRLPVSQALHLALPPLARRRRRPRADRGVGGDHAATCPGRRGRSAAPWRRGWRASTSSTRSSTSRSTASRACTRGRFASASAGRFAGARVLHLLTVALLVVAGLGLPVGLPYWLGVLVGRRAARLRALARPPGRPAPARRRVLHDERRDLGRVLRLRARGRGLRNRLLVGLLHPGEMGSAVGAALRANGHDVVWASSGRSDETTRRAWRRSCATSARSRRCSPRPSSSLDRAAAARRAVAAGGGRASHGIYVDANAISPATVRGWRRRGSCDGGIVGPPPRIGPERRGSICRATAPRTWRLCSPARRSTRESSTAGSGGLRAEDDVRGVVEGNGRDAPRDPRRCARKRRRGRVARGVGDSAPELLERLPQAERSAGDERLALDRRDGGDRRHVRSRRASPTASTARRPRSTARGRRRDPGARSSRSATATAASSATSTSTWPPAASCSSPAPNGSGKTTLLRVLAGLAAPSAGELQLPRARGRSAISATSRSSIAS